MKSPVSQCPLRSSFSCHHKSSVQSLQDVVLPIAAGLKGASVNDTRQLRASVIVLVYVSPAEGGWQCNRSATIPSVPSGNVLGPCSPKRRSLFTKLEKQSASSRIISRGRSNGREPHGLQTVANGSHSANKRATLHHGDLGTATSGPTSDGKPSQSSLVKTVPPHLSLPGVPMLVWQARTPLLCSNADASNAAKTTKEMSPQG